MKNYTHLTSTFLPLFLSKPLALFSMNDFVVKSYRYIINILVTLLWFWRLFDICFLYVILKCNIDNHLQTIFYVTDWKNLVGVRTVYRSIDHMIKTSPLEFYVTTDRLIDQSNSMNSRIFLIIVTWRKKDKKFDIDMRYLVSHELTHIKTMQDWNILI